MIGKKLAHYEILSKLGSGGMGDVYRARDTRLHREVGLKILPGEAAADPARLERFRREAQMLASLDHPGIVTVFSVDEADGVHFLTMALVEGRTLDRLVPAGGMDAGKFLEIAVPLAEAIAVAHERGVVHRDLKPGNVMITGDGRVKVLDFGLAKLMEEEYPALAGDRTEQLLTGAGVVMGTPAYMSPEQIQGRDTDARSDLFSLGVMFYEMLTGAHPFRAAVPAATTAAILKDIPRAPTAIRPDFPAALEEIVLGCLEKDPDRRPRSAGLLREQLEAARAGATAVEAAMPPSVAVLPFSDLSPGKDQDYFCDGIAEEITSALAQIRGLRVASRTSAMRYKKTEVDSRTIGKELGVGTLLEGSVRKAGERLRITAQLIDTGSDSHLWTERYDRTLDDVFAIQEDIAKSIVEALRVTLAPGETSGLVRAPTSRAEAYDYYLRGRSFFYRDREQDHEFAREMFRKALELDPSFTRAWAGLADTNSYLYKHFRKEAPLLEEADRASARAVELDPASAEAHTSRAVVHWLGGRTEDAEREFRTAVGLDPDLFEAHYHRAQWCMTTGRLEEAVRHFERAAEARPEDYQASLIAGSVYRGLGRHEEAAAASRRGLAAAEKHLELNPDDSRAWYLSAHALVVLGEREKALTWARRALTIDPDTSLVLYNVAGIFANLGLLDEGLDMIEGAVAHGFTYRGGLENDPDLAPLRSHPRFVKLLASLE